MRGQGGKGVACVGDSQAMYRSSAAAAEIPIGAENLEELDQGERRRRRVEELRVEQSPGAVLGLVESLADPDWRVRRSAATALAGETDVDASSILGDLLYSDDAGERNAAIKALIKRNTESMQVLVRELGSHEADVRNFAALALGQIGDPAALEHLVPMLDSEEDENVRHMVIEALGRIGSEEAVGPLLGVLEEGTFASVAAAEALGAIESCRAVMPLASKLGDDPIGAACAEALGRLGDVRGVAPLVRSMKGSSVMYGTSVVRALADLVQPEDPAAAAVSAVLRDQLRPDAAAELRDAIVACLGNDGEDRVAGMKVAVWLGVPELTPAVCQAAQTPELIGYASRFLAEGIEGVRDHLEAAARSTYPAVRSVLARALGMAGDERDVPMVLRLIDDENISVRIDAICALASLGGAEHASVLARLLTDEFEEVRTAAAEVLATLEEDVALEELSTMAESGDESMRLAVASVLERTEWRAGQERLWDLALTLARDPSPRVRKQVTPALGKMEGHEALSVLLTLALDDDHQLRVTAIRTLAMRSEETARRALRQAIEEGSTSITSAALRGLALGADSEDVALVRSLLHSSDIGIVVSALGALRRCGSAEEVPAVVQLVKHPVPDVREAALRTLIAIGPSDIAVLVLSGTEPSWNVRLAAVEALERCRVPDVRSVMERALTDEEPLVRRKAVSIIAGAYGEEGVDRLVEMLADDLLADEALEGLEELGGSAVPRLIALSPMVTLAVCRRIYVALGRIGTPEGVEHLLELLESDDVEHRWAAALGLSVCERADHALRLEECASAETDESVRAAVHAAIESARRGGGTE